MSYYFRERPRFSERLRGKSGDELLQELKQQFGDDADFFGDTGTAAPTAEHASRPRRDIFERHTSFPRGFPFDEELGGFGRRSADIRSHLDDLAARHPEFADHLIDPLWAEAAFPAGTSPSSTLHRGWPRNAAQTRRGSADRHNQPDEDARSQASGSSAASGASAVSSHGSEPDTQQQQQQTNKIPQYGLRNTVDIGQHQHNMENPQQQRNIRSMSAPPENRNNQDAAGQQPGQRFVSRVEITPQSQQQQQANQQQQPQTPPQPQPQPQQQREKSPAPAQKPQTQQSQQHGTVRHIPIFVEGRDEPVIPKGHADETDFPRRPPSPPQFQRPSHYQQHYSKPSPNWTHFQDPFFEPPPSRWGHSQFKNEKPWPSQAHFAEPQPQKTRTQQTAHHPESQWQKPQAQPQAQKQQPQQQRPQNEQQHEPPKPKQQVQPKDPLEKVALVQQEVDALTEQVKQFTGNSRQDKQYMYLDEMLTRELIKLDDIDTEGKENVRTARKQAIKSIQESISLLESKAPLPGQQPEEALPQQSEEEKNKEQPMETGNQVASTEEKPADNMETAEAQPTAQEEQKQEAIPLPPPSPSKAAAETQPENVAQQNNESSVENQEPAQNADEVQPAAVVQDASSAQTVEENQQQQPAEPVDNSNVSTEAAPQQQQEMEVRQSSPVKELQPTAAEQQKENQAPIAAEQNQETKETTVPAPKASIKTEKPKKEPPPVPEKPGKSPKKAKKTKKQPPQTEPVSETAIPLPAPGQSI